MVSMPVTLLATVAYDREATRGRAMDREGLRRRDALRRAAIVRSTKRNTKDRKKGSCVRWEECDGNPCLECVEAQL